MKKIKISEKGRIAYLCILFLVLAFSLTAWRTSQNARRLMGDSLSITQNDTSTTEKPTLKAVEIPVTNVPDTRESETETETEEKTTEKIQPLDYFIAPVEGKILAHYSNGELVRNENTNDWRTHNGTDFAANGSDDVYSINNGVVTAVYSDSLWGTVIEIDHGNRVTAKYCGLKENVSVTVGEKVKSGERIGNVGVIPIESGNAHIHLEMRSGGVLINPIDVIR